MIATIRGTLTARQAGRIVVEAAGVGYEIFVPLSTYYRLPAAGEAVSLEVRQVVREDALSLYGFSTLSEKRAFDLLVGVQKIGPRLALAILSVLSPDELSQAIADQDTKRLHAVPGVGPKVAERVVRELSDRISVLRTAEAAAARRRTNGGPSARPDAAPPNDTLDDAVSALMNLGIKPTEARRAVESVIDSGRSDALDLESTIRQSLALLLGER